jgi:uncharacterized cupin superfamily protein
MPKLDLDAIPADGACSYPSPFDQPCLGVISQRLGGAAGLTTIGVNLTRLPPGVWSSQRHWHSHEDELVYVMEGELALVTDEGETPLRAGDYAAFKAGVANGHHLVNRSRRDAVVLEIGARDLDHDTCTYPDIDLLARPADPDFAHRDGTPYPTRVTSTWLIGQEP